MSKIIFITNKSQEKNEEYNSQNDSKQFYHLFLAGTPGFEPRQAGLKAAVLPLHHTPIDTYII